MKKVLMVLLVLALVVALAACGYGTSATVSASDHTTSTQDGATSGDVATVQTGPVAEPDYEEPITPEPIIVEPEDPFAALVVSEEFARNNAGFYIIRDGKWYSLNRLTRDTGIQYGFGKRDVYGGRDLGLYSIENRHDFLSMGPVPIMTLRPGDQLISFVETQTTLSSVDFVGYTVKLVHNTNSGVNSDTYLFADLDSDKVVIPRSSLDTLEVCDANGNAVADYRNLSYGETYTISWFEGTNYHEIVMVADCSFYVPSGNPLYYDLKGTLSKESYAYYDFSAVQPGIYEFVAGGQVTIIRVE